MNLNAPKHPWPRLVAAARTVRDDRDTAAPYGFATRIVARAFGAEAHTVSLVERFALRAVGIACLLALASVAVNYGALKGNANVARVAPAAEVIDSAPNYDAVAVVLDLSD